MKQALILAGGKGTRLASILNGKPKPLVEINGTPLLKHILDYVASYGINNVVILVNYEAKQIENFVIDYTKSSTMTIRCVDDGEPQGTAGAIIKNIDFLEDEFFVIYGDTYSDINLKMLYEAHRKRILSDCTVVVHPNDHPQDSDILIVDDSNRVIAIDAYPHPHNVYLPNLVNAALCYTKKSMFEGVIPNCIPYDIAKNLLRDQCSSKRIYAYNTYEYIKDCGTPERVRKVERDIISGKVQSLNKNAKHSVVFLDRDGTINKEVSHLKTLNDFELLPNVSKAIGVLNKSGKLTCVVTNQPVIARGECDVNTLKSIHNKMETILGDEGAYIDRIIFCPHHPDSGYENEVADLKVKCDCRKPSLGMFHNVSEEFNILISQSWMIGDTTTDIMFAKNAGLKSILLKTGYAGLDYKYPVTADYHFDSLLDAAQFITNGYDTLFQQVNKLSINNERFISIIGQSRAGKSNLASVVKDYFTSIGRECVVVSTDRFFLSNNDRGEHPHSKIDTKALLDIINIINNCVSDSYIRLPIYDKLKKRISNSFENVLIKPNSVVVVEGISSDVILEHFKSKLIYVNVDEDIRKSRFINEYLSRGLVMNEIIDIYNNRLDAEFDYINNLKIKAELSL